MWWLLNESIISGLSLIGIIFLLLYYYGTANYDFWKLRGIPYIRPKYPFLGSLYESFLALRSTHEIQQKYYKHFNGERFGGLFQFQFPILMLKDPSLVESVLIKDFSSFYNRGTSVDVKKEPLSAHLINLEGKLWKSLRQKLTPTFSSGKLKGMHQQLVDCSDLLVNYIELLYAKRSDEPIEVREVMAKFTTDVIGSCAFGLNTNALKDPNSEFRKMGKQIFQPSRFGVMVATLRNIYPTVARILIKVSNATNTREFFSRILKSTMKYREQNKVVRNDFVQLLMELKKQDAEKLQSGKQIDEDELTIDDSVIAANATVFFVAGFETTASTLSYCLYELSLHPDIQEQAYQHVVAVLKKHGGEVTYDAIKEMFFIKQIFAETLRMHPPAVEIRRKVTKDYVIPGTNVLLPVGSTVSIPIYSFHHDPKYFPEPEKFLPERFDKSKEDNIKKGTYLPFGNGPRICIGERFAKMEMQVGLVKLLLKYKFTLNPKTISPLKYNPSTLLLVPIGGIWIDLHKRD